MEYFKYRGYIGSITFSTEDNYFFGHVQGLRDSCVIYEGDTVEELRDDFEAGVDVYLDACREYKVEPEKTVYCTDEDSTISRFTFSRCFSC